YPYSPRQCGHSFCAICVLNWFKHEPTGLISPDRACPTCRSALVDPSQTSLTTNSLFPFTPNRTAQDVIRCMIDTISKEADSGNVSASDSLAKWGGNGSTREEWRQKERYFALKFSP
ncbi:hypothetical protein K503DRAFT_682670, partial [Rhizopogon vinicolor AM-OR11-026]